MIVQVINNAYSVGASRIDTRHRVLNNAEVSELVTLMQQVGFRGVGWGRALSEEWFPADIVSVLSRCIMTRC